MGCDQRTPHSSKRTTHSLQASSVGHTQAMKFFVTGCQSLLGVLGTPPPPIWQPVTKNFMAWVWPTELAWSECVVRLLECGVLWSQPIAQSHTVAHHLVSKTFSPEGGESATTLLSSSGVCHRTEWR